jgi:predicted GNAT family acetyltransferase
MEFQLTDNPNENQFEANIEGHIAKMEYILNRNEIYLTNTDVPSALGGKGIGSKLMVSVLEEAEKRNLRIIPLCPFVISYFKRHPEWKRLL